MFVSFGGHSRPELLEMLSSAGVRTNEYAQTLLKNPVFDQPAKSAIRVLERSVENLGLLEGGTLSEIFEAAVSQGLDVVPLVAAPYIRIALSNQAQASDAVLSGGRVPSGSVTIASYPPSVDEEYPKGFYLRIVDGESWLRGYRCSDDYVFEPVSRFLFVSPLG